MVTFSTKADKAFISVGYDNWKKAKARFRSHQSSHVHCEAVLKLSCADRPSVITQLDSGRMKDQEMRRKMFLTELSTLKYLC